MSNARQYIHVWWPLTSHQTPLVTSDAKLLKEQKFKVATAPPRDPEWATASLIRCILRHHALTRLLSSQQPILLSETSATQRWQSLQSQGQGYLWRSPWPLQLAELRLGLFLWRQENYTNLFTQSHPRDGACSTNVLGAVPARQIS